jgi:DNA invertase Pin-like site-specific DNA recombinase
MERDLIRERTNAGLAAARGPTPQKWPKPEFNAKQIGRARKLLADRDKSKTSPKPLALVSRVTI